MTKRIDLGKLAEKITEREQFPVLFKTDYQRRKTAKMRQKFAILLRRRKAFDRLSA